ncbi:hypothetical protein EAE32_06595 [Kocuria tytonicola]|uniref:Uncharacterized protein n=1 Tax=Kocuria tytonicola TaxID=2055946 RepID=A0A3L9L745_9MICC|nr:hypothetical protein [Kocuria tytonicola]RLY94803.1 hypothetical protein EAE32_06595 [Kocuria tytonicola]
MPQRQNLKPALADTLRQLRNDVQSGATVPHGIKTVEPGEGLQLVPPGDGAEIFWDWETANSVEQRIQDGTALIDQTRATLAQTEQTLADAQDRIGRVAAGEIEKIDGHIIINGTVDLPALNVTGEMAATVVKALDVTARRGIFTEGLTAQDSTLLGTTVAEVINAGTVATRIMTSGLLQTTTASTRGVKIDNAGIRAWDEDGQQSVQINGRNNYLVGELSTAPDRQRVRLRSTGSIAAADFFGSNNTIDHLAIWHQADAGQDTVSKIISHNVMAQGKGNPGMLMFPFRGEFAFTGRWAQESDTVKFFRMDNDRGLPAGGYVDVVYTYRFAFTSQYTVLMPYLSVETASGRECIAMIMQLTYSTIKVRIVNKSAGDTGSLKVRGVVFNVNEGLYSNYF